MTTPYLIAARQGIILWVTLTLIPVEVVFEWREKEGAAHPGEIGAVNWAPQPR